MIATLDYRVTIDETNTANNSDVPAQQTQSFTVEFGHNGTGDGVVTGDVEFDEQPEEPSEPPTDWRDLDVEQDRDGSPDEQQTFHRWPVTPRARSPPRGSSFFFFKAGDMPKRIQRKRTKGWRMPAGAVYVGQPTKWGNPFRIGETVSGEHEPQDEHDLIESVEDSVEAYETWVHLGVIPESDIDELRGRDLACWCPLDQPCHADVLLDLANR